VNKLVYIAIFILTMLFSLSSIVNADEKLFFIKDITFEKNDMEVVTELSNLTFNISPLNARIFLCDDVCKEEDIKSVSYSGNEIEFFLIPNKTGSYLLRVMIPIDGIKRFDEKFVEINKSFIGDRKRSSKGGKDDKTNNNIITGNLIESASSPFMIFGYLSTLTLTIFYSLRKNLYKMKKYALSHLNTLENVFLFLFSMLILSTITHELFHLAVAGFFGCPCKIEASFLGPKTVTLENCAVTKLESILILGAGLLGNIILGFVLTILSKVKKSTKLHIVSFSLMLSSFIYFFYAKGDIHNILSIIGLRVPQLYLNLIGVFLSLSSGVFFFRKIFK